MLPPAHALKIYRWTKKGPRICTLAPGAQQNDPTLPPRPYALDHSKGRTFTTSQGWVRPNTRQKDSQDSLQYGRCLTADLAEPARGASVHGCTRVRPCDSYRARTATLKLGYYTHYRRSLVEGTLSLLPRTDVACPVYFSSSQPHQKCKHNTRPCTGDPPAITVFGAWSAPFDN